MNRISLHISSLVKHCNSVAKLILLIVLTGCISGAYAETETIEGTNTSLYGKIVRSNDTLIIKGNLTIPNNKTATLEERSVLYVTGDLTISKDATLNIGSKSKLIVGRNLNQDGNGSLKVGEIEANDVFVVIGGNYTIYDKKGDYATDRQYLDPENNTMYIFGTNELNGIYGDDSPKLNNIKTEEEFLAEYGSIPALLPIELVSFKATATNNGFVFNWVTASEVENDYFTLEYSIDGVDFNKIDYIHGAGTTSETSEYEYRWDEAPEFDVVYFRLKQTDYNGEYSYSDVIAASRKKSSGANGTFRYGPLNLQIQDGELRYIVK